MEREITVKPGTVKINDLEFAGQDRLEKLILPDSVTEIGKYAFMNCYSLREIRMPERVELVGAGLFQNCWQLRKLTIPEGVETLGSDMFENCHELSDLTLPSSLKKVEKTAFSRCKNLKYIHVDPEKLDILPVSARYTAVLTFMEEHSGNAFGSSESEPPSFRAIDSYVSERRNSLLDLAVNRRSTDAVRYMLDHGLIAEDSIGEYLKRSVESGRVEITALLLDKIGEHGSGNNQKKHAGMDGDPFA